MPLDRAAILSAKREQEGKDLFHRYQAALKLKFRIVYLDEVKFQEHVEWNNVKTWAGPNENITVTHVAPKSENVRVFMAMDKE